MRPSTPPRMKSSLALVMFLCCIFLPGATQIVVGIAHEFDVGYILVGILQFALAPFLVGWVWSIAWGARALGNAEDADIPNDTTPLIQEGEEEET
eukprot:IDg4114t1